MCSGIVGMEFFIVNIAILNLAIKSNNSQVNKNTNVKEIKAVTINTEFTAEMKATDTCQISDVKRGYSINEDFQNL